MSRCRLQRKLRVAKARQHARRLARAERLAQFRDAEAMACALVDALDASEQDR